MTKLSRINEACLPSQFRWNEDLQTSLRVRLVLLSEDDQCVMEFDGANVRWLGFAGAIEWVEGRLQLSDQSGNILATSTGLDYGVVTFSVNDTNYCFECVPKNWRQRMFLHDGHEDVIDSYSGNFAFEILRRVECLPQVVAMYWAIRKGCDL